MQLGKTATNRTAPLGKNRGFDGVVRFGGVYQTALAPYDSAFHQTEPHCTVGFSKSTIRTEPHPKNVHKNKPAVRP